LPSPLATATLTASAIKPLLTQHAARLAAGVGVDHPLNLAALKIDRPVAGRQSLASAFE
jgi:hypothetical protein